MLLADAKEGIPQGLKPASLAGGSAEAEASAYLEAKGEGQATASAHAGPSTRVSRFAQDDTSEVTRHERSEAARNDGVVEAVAGEFAIAEFLAAEQAKDLLRFSTAGSVDDGKSTLIGRLLYDSRNVYEDQVRAVTGTVSIGGVKNTAIDFAQLTDGLRAEREQGITIDVAYRYFSTQRRKFIIADTPGHEQYTRNMATGASTAELAIILIDARKGILTQSRRHAFIASLLGIRNLVAAVNKMDLVDFSEGVFRKIEGELRELVEGSFASANDVPLIAKDKGAMNGAPGFLTPAEIASHVSESRHGAPRLTVIPVSALEGDNVVERSTRMPWYDGPTLLEYLEVVPVGAVDAGAAFRMPVQRVIRPDQNYRGFAGQIAAGMIRRGDAIVALPSGRRSRVASITTFDGDLEAASAPQSIALTLEDELDISRGDLIATPEAQPQQATALEADLVWFDGARLETEKPYLLKHGAQTLAARVTRVKHRVNIQTLKHEAVNSLGMNDIGVVEIAVTRPLFFDAYRQNRATGSFILIDPATNATAAAGMVRGGVAGAVGEARQGALVRVSNADRAELLETALLVAGEVVVRTRVTDSQVLQRLVGVGVVVIVEASEDVAGALDGDSEGAVERVLKGVRP